MRFNRRQMEQAKRRTAGASWWLAYFLGFLFGACLMFGASRFFP